MIAEVLRHRTRAETVLEFYPRFVAGFPSWRRLGNASEADLREYLEAIGLWRRRASSLRCFSNAMVERGGRCPKLRDEIEALSGVGQYIANSILLLVHDEREPFLEGGIGRVL